MRKSKHSEEKMVSILKEIEDGFGVTEVARKHNLSVQTISRWREKFAGMQGTDVKKLKILEEENRRLKKIVGDMALENEAMKDLIEKKL